MSNVAAKLPSSLPPSGAVSGRWGSRKGNSAAALCLKRLGVPFLFTARRINDSDMGDLSLGTPDAAGSGQWVVACQTQLIMPWSPYSRFAHHTDVQTRRPQLLLRVSGPAHLSEFPTGWQTSTVTVAPDLR